MNALYLPFTQLADHVITDAISRARIVATTLALAASNLAALPTSAVDNPENHFQMQVLPAIRNTLSAFNENVVFDMRCALECARTFWMLRYTAAYPGVRPFSRDDCNFFDALHGVTVLVSDDMCTFVNTHKKAIFQLLISAQGILAQLNEQAGQDPI